MVNAAVTKILRPEREAGMGGEIEAAPAELDLVYPLSAVRYHKVNQIRALDGREVTVDATFLLDLTDDEENPITVQMGDLMEWTMVDGSPDSGTATEVVAANQYSSPGLASAGCIEVLSKGS